MNHQVTIKKKKESWYGKQTKKFAQQYQKDCEEIAKYYDKIWTDYWARFESENKSTADNTIKRLKP